MNMSSSQAHRKLGGESSWNDRDIDAIAKHFGVTVLDVLKLPKLDEPPIVPARLHLGGQWFDCQARLTDRHQQDQISEFLAFVRDGCWVVAHHLSEQLGHIEPQNLRQVATIRIPVRQIARRHVALIGVPSAQPVVDALESAGLPCEVIPTLDQALGRADLQLFEALILPWTKSPALNAQCEATIRTVRSNREGGGARLPVLVLLGVDRHEDSHGIPHVEHVESLVSRYAVSGLYRTPFPPSLVCAQVRQWIEQCRAREPIADFDDSGHSELR